jgi:hypothetical protein
MLMSKINFKNKKNIFWCIFKQKTLWKTTSTAISNTPLILNYTNLFFLWKAKNYHNICKTYFQPQNKFNNWIIFLSFRSIIELYFINLRFLLSNHVHAKIYIYIYIYIYNYWIIFRSLRSPFSLETKNKLNKNHHLK